MKKVGVLLALLGAALLLGSFLSLPAAGDNRAMPRPAPTVPTADVAARGAALFRAKGCVTCHRHDGVDGQGLAVGPDLTRYLGDPEFLRRWLADPASVRPETFMPNLGLEEGEIEALIAFLTTE